MSKMPPQLVMHGMQLGHDALTNFEFRSDRPYTYCRICGALYQTNDDRMVRDELSIAAVFARDARKVWSQQHARTHADNTHRYLAASGLWLLPEAANKLAPFGIVPVMDMVISDEVEHALAVAPALPANNPQGSDA